MKKHRRIVTLMSSLTKRTIRYMRLLFIGGLLLSIPIISSTSHVAADPMKKHTNNGSMQTDCAAFCARTNNLPPQETAVAPEENRAPDPIPSTYELNLPSFGNVSPPRVLRSYVYGSYSIRPPDILKLYGKYRF